MIAYNYIVPLKICLLLITYLSGCCAFIDGIMDDPIALENILKAHDFERTYRASASVLGDAFYELPERDDLATAAPGTLFKVERETNTSRYTLAPNLSLSRFMYQSQTSNGTLVPVTGYVLWPYVPRKHPVKGYPVVAWAHGTSGVNVECPPSNIQNLWHHFQAPYQLALNGYVVVATDYAGLGLKTDSLGRAISHEYLTAPAQANDVLNSIPAVRAAFPELSEEFILLGSSQGGSAVWSCAEKLASNPIKGYLGTVSLSPVTRLLDIPSDSNIFPLLAIMLIPGLLANFPDFDPTEILSQQGMSSYSTYVGLNGCNSVLYNLPISDKTLNPAWKSSPVLQKYGQLAEVGRKDFAGPMLVMTGGADPIVYPPSVTNAVEATAQLFPDKSLEFYLLPDVSHAPAMYAGWQVYIEWIKQRFDGIASEPGYGNKSDEMIPIRQKSAQQFEANWYIQNFTASWQLT